MCSVLVPPAIFGTLPYSVRENKVACVPFKRVIGMYRLQGVRGVKGVMENHRERIETGWNGIWIYTRWIGIVTDTVGFTGAPTSDRPSRVPL